MGVGMDSVFNRCAEAALVNTSEIVAAHGPRVSGTPGCDGARAALKALLSQSCTSVVEQDFALHPESLNAIGKVFALAYLIGSAAILVGGAIPLAIGLAAMSLALGYFAVVFLLYLDSLDGLFKRVRGANLIGTLEPKAEAKRQIILVGHLDSARVYSFYERHPELFPIRLLAAVSFFVLCIVALAAGLILGSLPVWVKCLLLLGVILAAPMYGYVSKKGSLGAGDNLIGCAICLELARIFADHAQALENTRLIVLLTDGEEIGQKGAKAFIRDKSALLRSIDTRVINIDSIYDYGELALLRRDRNGFTPLSKELTEELRAAARAIGHDFRICSIPFLGGGTDAAQFARAGLETASVLAQPIAVGRKDIVFHTSRDLPGKISGRAVAAVIGTIAEYLRKADGPTSPASRPRSRSHRRRSTSRSRSHNSGRCRCGCRWWIPRPRSRST
jgi:aminopeptidase YwaD